MGLDATTTASTALDLLGVFVAGVLGGEVAARRRLDLAGYLGLAIAAGLGGGMLRDVLLARGTPLALTEPCYVLTAVAAAGMAFLFHRRRRIGHLALTTLDGLAMAFWAVSGSERAAAAGLGLLTVLLLGVITAVGGGVIRDVLAGQSPGVFANQSLYATAALVAASLYALLTALSVPTLVTVPVSVAAGFCVRMLSLRYGWRLPDRPPQSKKRSS